MRKVDALLSPPNLTIACSLLLATNLAFAAPDFTHQVTPQASIIAAKAHEAETIAIAEAKEHAAETIAAAKAKAQIEVAKTKAIQSMHQREMTSAVDKAKAEAGLTSVEANANVTKAAAHAQIEDALANANVAKADANADIAIAKANAAVEKARATAQIEIAEANASVAKAKANTKVKLLEARELTGIITTPEPISAQPKPSIPKIPKPSNEPMPGPVPSRPIPEPAPGPNTSSVVPEPKPKAVPKSAGKPKASPSPKPRSKPTSDHNTGITQQELGATSHKTLEQAVQTKPKTLENKATQQNQKETVTTAPAVSPLIPGQNTAEARKAAAQETAGEYQINPDGSAPTAASPLTYEVSTWGKQITVSMTQDDITKNLRFNKYNKNIYDTAFTTFLANENLRYAFAIAAAAVKQLPRSLVWRERLAKVASWYDQPITALNEWMYLAKKTKRMYYVNEGIKVAEDFNEIEKLAELYKIAIENHPKHEPSWQGFINAQSDLAEPEVAIDELKKAHKVSPEKFYLLKLAELYRDIGDKESQQMILEQIVREYGMSPEANLRLALVYFKEAKVKKAHEQLLKTFKLAKPEDVQFWQTFADVAWLMQDRDMAFQAYDILHAANQLNEAGFGNYVTLMKTKDPKRALVLAQQGWDKFKSVDFAINVLETNYQLKEYNKVADFYKTIPADVKAELEKRLFINTLYADTLSKLGNKKAAFDIFSRSLREFPDNNDLKISYLWFLMDNEDKERLQQAVREYKPLAEKDEKYWQAFASANFMLLNVKQALWWNQKMWPKNKNDAEWLLFLATTLEFHHMDGLAKQMRRRAWRAIQVEMSKTKELTTNQIYRYALIARSEAPADISMAAMSALADKAPEPLHTELLVLWALARNNVPLAERFWKNSPTGPMIPVWMQQTISLRNDDRYELAKIIKKPESNITYLDRITSAKRIGANRFAATLAYDALKDHPDNPATAKTFKDVMLPMSDQFTIGTIYRQAANIIGPDAFMKFKLWLTPTFNIQPYTNYWLVRSDDLTLTNLKRTHDLEVGADLQWMQERGSTTLRLATEKGLARHYTAGLTFKHLLAYDIDGSLSFGYHKNSNISSVMNIAGMENNIRAEISHTMTYSDSVSLVLQASRYYSQDDTFLGSGKMFDAQYTHKWDLDYPDWNYGLFINGNDYAGSGKVSRKAAKLVPAGTIPTVGFFIPQDFLQYGVRFGFGQNFEREYTHEWRPYANFAIFRNSLTGYGKSLRVGIAGMLAGRDHLNLFFNYSDNAQDQNQKDIQAGIVYNLYF